MVRLLAPWVLLAVALGGCARVGFTGQGRPPDARPSPDRSPDGGVSDAMPVDAAPDMTVLLCDTGAASADLIAPSTPFGTPVSVAAINTASYMDDDPWLTEDGLELYFSSERPGGAGAEDLWVATRSTATAPWAIKNLAVLNSPGADSSAGVTSDALTIYFSSDRQGTQEADVFVSTRPSRTAPWGAPTLVSELSSALSDCGPRPAPGPCPRYLVLDRREPNLASGELYMATRPNPSGPWNPPTPITELNTAGYDRMPWINASGTLIVFSSSRSGNEDLWMAERATPGVPFGAPVNAPFAALNTASREGDPWLSPDLRTIYFSRETAGQYDIYAATR